MTADFELRPQSMILTYRVDGADAVKVPEVCNPGRQDGLWQRTCLEAFVALDHEAYIELNFSPCAEWAAYRFDGYRLGMTALDIPPPSIAPVFGRRILELGISIALVELTPLRLGLSAVIEEKDGTKSYWALRHPPGDKPDFHHPDCFALELPPA
ncbi:DOMON-like domain-containing protein [Sphingomonas sp.]|uniref:DOMON-like domain-containing protein n=1 Tax=Sphingomonas sp. TaxID=28214 RepID=UPI002DBADD37|nr:DOMON-like domain-containing protein [Sphingomonas sp.]HEU4970112.1 DOMON-like domain-containing protein [Sphingomonas sp.]